jgi:hypothetical protein
MQSRKLLLQLCTGPSGKHKDLTSHGTLAARLRRLFFGLLNPTTRHARIIID